MGHYVEGILRITILEASVALLICARLARSDDARLGRRLDFAFRAVAVLALFSWTHFGSLRGGDRLVHRWEQYHFFFGSKYLPEINYFNLYKATILADRESAHILTRVTQTRDLTNFELQPVEAALANASEVRAAFSDARWRDFVADWSKLAAGGADWTNIMADHGNSGSPAWAVIAAPIARVCGMGPVGQQLMGLVDPLLMIILFGFVFRTFGTRPACVMLTIWSMIPFCFDYLAGSLLRWDWLFALGMCLVMWRRNRPLTAGAFLGYAVASKLFPLWFGVAFALERLWAMRRTRQLDRRLVRFAAGGAAAMTVAVVVSSLMFGGFHIWKSYKDRIQVAQVEKYYPNQYSFRTVFLQFYESSPRQVIDGWAQPREIKQARPDIDIANRRVPFLLVQLFLTALVAAALAFSDEVEALAVGPFLVYVWLMVNAYYWNMLALPALAWAVREFDGRRGRLVPLVGLHVLLAWFYLYEHFNRGFSEGYFVGLLLCGLLVTWSISAVVAGRKTGTT
ncbi:MAG: hypothetical protein JWN44_3321 [Myxococcales bacterium]|nr:hypothetical protein [Myxococcales bacterium]